MTVSVHGQTEEYWFTFKVNSVVKKGTEQYLVTINHGSEIGLTVNQSGELYTTVNPN